MRHQADERARKKVREALKQLEAGIAAFIDGESFARYLRFLARFHTYSAHNALLIQAQRPDATRVAGYRSWQAFGRQVRKGSCARCCARPCTGCSAGN